MVAFIYDADDEEELADGEELEDEEELSAPAVAEPAAPFIAQALLNCGGVARNKAAKAVTKLLIDIVSVGKHRYEHPAPDRVEPILGVQELEDEELQLQARYYEFTHLHVVHEA